MIWNLKRQLNRLGRRANPDRKFRVALEHRLQAAGYLPVSRWYHFNLWKTALVSSGLVLSLGAATATYAYTSNDVLPDHPLYPLRTGLESIETQLAFSPKQKTAVELKHLQRRVQEARLLQQKHPDARPEAVSAVTNQIQEEVANLPAPASSADDADAVSVIKDELNLNNQEMKDLAEQQEDALDDQSRKAAAAMLKEDTDQLEQSVQALQAEQEHAAKRATHQQKTDAPIPPSEDHPQDSPDLED